MKMSAIQVPGTRRNFLELNFRLQSFYQFALQERVANRNNIDKNQENDMGKEMLTMQR